MSDEVQLSSGQTARLEDGAVRVVRSKQETQHHFRMSLSHPDTVLPTSALAASYDLLIPFLRQLESLGYVLGTIQRVEGAAPR